MSAREVDSLSEFIRNILQNVNTCTSCSDDSWSTLDSESDKTQGQSYGDDQFERFFYHTVTEETEITLNFVSNVFFSVFKNKLNADFSESIKNNELQTVSKFIMHIKGLKCDVKVDSTVNTVAVAGVGRIKWRREYFPRVAQTLFRRYRIHDVQEAESQVHDSQTEEMQVHDSQTGEMQVVQYPLEIAGKISSGVPRCTSTPIVPHLAQRDKVSSSEKQPFTVVFQQIENMESVVWDLKQSIINSMERKIEELKTTLVKSIDEMTSKQTYADMARHSTWHGSRSPQDIEEGYCKNSANTATPDSSQTHAKTPYESESPSAIVPSHNTAISSTPQPVPVRTTNRNEIREIPSEMNHGGFPPGLVTNQNAGISNSHANVPGGEKTLLIGDSILNNVGHRGLRYNTQKHSKLRAKIRHIRQEISTYDLNAFSDIIIYVGGNDAASQVHDELFEEMYDRLINKIKTANTECKIYLCKIAPRGDADVTKYNGCTDSLAVHWRNRDVKEIQQTYQYMFGENGLPLSPVLLGRRDTFIHIGTQKTSGCHKYRNADSQRF